MIGDDDSVEPGPEQFALSISVGQLKVKWLKG